MWFGGKLLNTTPHQTMIGRADFEGYSAVLAQGCDAGDGTVLSLH